jgi:hypothetical protein
MFSNTRLPCIALKGFSLFALHLLAFMLVSFHLFFKKFYFYGLISILVLNLWLLYQFDMPIKKKKIEFKIKLDSRESHMAHL